MHHVSKKAVMIGAMALAIGVASVATGVNAKSTHGSQGSTKSAEAKLKHAPKAPKMHKRTIPGKVVAWNTDMTSFTLMKGNKTYTVTLSTAPATTFTDRKWKAIDKSAIVTGHKVTVKGMVSGLTVTALSVRDISLPVKTTTTDTNN